MRFYLLSFFGSALLIDKILGWAGEENRNVDWRARAQNRVEFGIEDQVGNL